MLQILQQNSDLQHNLYRQLVLLRPGIFQQDKDHSWIDQVMVDDNPVDTHILVFLKDLRDLFFKDLRDLHLNSPHHRPDTQACHPQGCRFRLDNLHRSPHPYQAVLCPLYTAHTQSCRCSVLYPIGG